MPSWSFLITDPATLGTVSWLSALIGLLSMVLTVAGFWVAIVQIRKVKRAAEAAEAGSARMAEIVRARELSAKLSTVLSHLRSAANSLKADELTVSITYIDAGCSALVEAKHLASQHTDRSEFEDRLSRLRRQSEALQSAVLTQKSTTRPKNLVADVRHAIEVIEEIEARHRYNLFTREHNGEIV